MYKDDKALLSHGKLVKMLMMVNFHNSFPAGKELHVLKLIFTYKVER